MRVTKLIQVFEREYSFHPARANDSLSAVVYEAYKKVRPMKLSPFQTDEASLSLVADEAARLLAMRDFQTVADRFGYALAFEREPTIAIEEELLSCFAEFESLPAPRSAVCNSTVVKYFKKNDPGLYAVVECVFIAAKGCPVLAELIVTTEGEDKYVSLEQISLAAA